jgi:purine-binding chemotaxis protein CheW
MGAEGHAALVLVVGTRSYAVPLGLVRETMRPLPIEPLAGVPPFVRGLSIIRGVPTPVIDLGGLLGAPAERAQRFVTVQAGERQVALVVDSVLGVRSLASAAFGALPPLLQGAPAEAIEAVGTLDAQLLLVLRASRLVPDDVWRVLDARAAG